MAEQARITAPPPGTPRLQNTSHSRSQRRTRWLWTMGFALATVIAIAWLITGPYRVYRLAGTVRELMVSRQYEQAAPALKQWLMLKPHSAEAHYFRAWLLMGEARLQEAMGAIEEASRLGFDTVRLSCLKALVQAKGGRLPEAGPALLQAYRQETEPRLDVARELARLYLSTYRLSQARDPIERWRTLAPDDALPYMWLNEIESRSDAEPPLLIQNYRAALQRDPGLSSARLGLAEQLIRDSKLEEAEKEYTSYLAEKPKDVNALVGLGRTKLALGDPQAAGRQFESALQIDPNQTEALRELAQIELSQGRHEFACKRLERLSAIEPHDHRVRYLFAQALKLTGDETRSRAETIKANELRKENDHLVELRNAVLDRPRDLNAKYEVARWMLEHGHEREGLDWTHQIFQVEPSHARTHRLLADHYTRKGNSGLANYHRLQSGAGEDDHRESGK